MDRTPCLNSLAADREYFKPDAGDAYEAFAATLPDDEFDEAADELARCWHGDECDDWSDEQWAAFKRDNCGQITELAWERA